ncbi:hypothetical protein LUW77_03185 [Streptomyces radiopugnans]|nr:hypothetical protein LUW77_03185 [Streptomyces radiopugnans]
MASAMAWTCSYSWRLRGDGAALAGFGDFGLGGFAVPPLVVDEGEFGAFAEYLEVGGVSEVELLLRGGRVVEVVLELGGAAGREEAAGAGGGQGGAVGVVVVGGQPVDDGRGRGGHCSSPLRQLSQT